MEVMIHERTVTNLLMLFATPVANFALVIGRCFVVKFVLEIYYAGKIDANRMGF